MAAAETTATRGGAGAPGPGRRTYGNFAKPQSAGLLGLGTVGTYALAGGSIVIIVVLATAGPLQAIVLAAVFALALLSIVRRDRHGANFLERSIVVIGWWAARARGLNIYRSGPLGRTPWGTNQLPGVAAASTLAQHQDSWSRPFALLHHPTSSSFTVVLGSEPDGASLVDAEQVDRWVAAWGDWLAGLGNIAGLEAASVTVETAPDHGARLRSEVARRRDPHAPDFAQAMLDEISATYAMGSSSVRAYVALTFSAALRSGGRRRRPAEVAQDLASRLPSLTATLSETGAGSVHPLDAQELCEVVRVAYDPGIADLMDRARAAREIAELSWSDVGPAAMQSSWDALRHDSGLSRTWAMTSAPKGNVFSSVLTNLLSPHPWVDRKRVTLLYRPIDPARAGDLVEKDVNAASFRASSRAKEVARDTRAVRAAKATAAEEASGAGLVRFGMLITATVTDPERARDAFAAVEGLAAGARLLVRPVYGSQESAFAGALPLGLVLHKHLQLPTALREAL